MNEQKRPDSTQINWDYKNDPTSVPSLTDVQKSSYQYYLSLVMYYNELVITQDLTEQDEELYQIGQEVEEAAELVNENYLAKTLDELRNK